ncbi:hypothetical protein GCM10010129_04460 [Streptomyces fumigatiscleroticus]|nr:hypothetical protein GCM10010129_04460 [Streptomyces fumigatiscleroticus]
MITPPVRTAAQRRQDTLHRLEHDAAAWVATADGEPGTPYLVPLSFLWNGSCLLFATPAAGPAGRNLASAGRVCVGIGEPRDVVLVEGTVRTLDPADLPEEDAELFAARTGFDPRRLAERHHYVRVTPRRVRAWRDAERPAGSELMRDGRWLPAD